MASGAGVPISSRGNYIAVHDFDGNAVYVIDNARHEYAVDLAREGYMPGDGPCWESRLHRGNTVQALSILLPEDDPSSIETAALVQNHVYDLYLRRGSLTSGGMFDAIYGAVFVGLGKQVQPGRGVSRLLIAQFEGGRYVPLVNLASGDVYDALITAGRLPAPPP